jgi:hypothetical protein
VSIQLTILNLQVMWMAALAFAVIAAIGAHDVVRIDRRRAVMRAGGCVFASAVALEYVYWWMRWLLKGENLLEHSAWFVANAHVTLAFGSLATAGVAMTAVAALWPNYGGWAVPIVLSCVCATWAVGFHV